MGLFSGLIGLGGFDDATGEITQQADKTRDFFRGEHEANTNALAPFIGAGTRGINALSDFVTGGGLGDLDATGEAILDRAFRDTEGRLAAQGLSDSGIGRNALLDTALRSRLGLRKNRLAEFSGLARFGPQAIGQRIRSGAIAGQGIARANETIGNAKAERSLNTANTLGNFADTVLNIPSSPGELREAARAVGGFA